ncbi:MAG: hypothetical protein JSS65_13385 [Armatimonadetes bacterium]|nr:hypothetical protein [Armatimonadota bacterium]
MADIAAVWHEALPEIMGGVTGVGVWTALKTAVPIAAEDGLLVLGLPDASSGLAGHLKLAAPRKMVEDTLSARLGSPVVLRVIAGTSAHDWETEKKRDVEKRRLQEQALARQRAEVLAGKSWESIYEQLSRQYATTPNRSLPQNRARFLQEAIAIVAQALIDTPISDEMAERNYARCLERVAQYSEVPSTMVAMMVLEKSFEG